MCWVPLACNILCNWQLSQPVTETDAVKPLKFLRAGGSNPDTGAAVETAGWGSLDNLGNRPDKLYEVTVTVITRSTCSRSNSYADAFTTNMLCAGKPRMDTCDVSFHLRFKTVSPWYESVIVWAFPHLSPYFDIFPLSHKQTEWRLTHASSKTLSRQQPNLLEQLLIIHYIAADH